MSKTATRPRKISAPAPAAVAEASSAATRTVGMPAAVAGLAHVSKCDCTVHRRPLDQADPLGGTAVPEDVTALLSRRRGRGQALDATTAQSMGEHLGADFRGVRVHADTEADSISRSVGAQAFTQGSDVYFTQGRYAPGTPSGDHLLAHELTHVRQHSQGNERGRGATIGRIDDPAEHEAEQAAGAVMSRLRRQADRSVAAQPGDSVAVRAEEPMSALRRQAARVGDAGPIRRNPFKNFFSRKKKVPAKTAATTTAAAAPATRPAAAAPTRPAGPAGTAPGPAVVGAAGTPSRSGAAPTRPRANRPITPPPPAPSATADPIAAGVGAAVPAIATPTVTAAAPALTTPVTTAAVAGADPVAAPVVAPEPAPAVSPPVAEAPVAAASTAAGPAAAPAVADPVAEPAPAVADPVVAQPAVADPAAAPAVAAPISTAAVAAALDPAVADPSAAAPPVKTAAQLFEEAVNPQTDPTDFADGETRMAALRIVLNTMTTAERLAISQNKALMGKGRKHVGDRAYLALLGAVGMKAPKKTSTGAETATHHLSGAEADVFIQTNIENYAHLKPFIHTAVAAGKKADGYVATVDDDDWEIAVRAQYNVDVSAKTSTNAFVANKNTDRPAILKSDRGTKSTAIHESMHRYSKLDVLHTYGSPMNEGMTEFFTRKLAAADATPAKDGGPERTNYQKNVTFIRTMLTMLGSDPVGQETKLAEIYYNGEPGKLKDAFVAAWKAKAGAPTDAEIEAKFTDLCAKVKNEEWAAATALLP